MIEFKTYSEDKTANELIKQFEQATIDLYNREENRQLKEHIEEHPHEEWREDQEETKVIFSILQDEHLNNVRTLYMREQVSETTFREVLHHITGDEYYFID